MIGPGTTIRGSISGDEDLVVEGRVEGSIQLSRELTVAAGATIEADVEAQGVFVSGSLKGSATGRETIVLERGATVSGALKTPRLVIADGAHFTGKVEMDFEIPGIESPRGGATRRR